MTPKNSVLVLAAGSLGDSILTLPALRALQSQYEVTVAGTAPYLALGAGLLGIRETVALDSLLQSLLSPGAASAFPEKFWTGFQKVLVFFKEKDGPLLEKLSSFKGLELSFPARPFSEFLEEGRWAAEYWLEAALPDAPTADSPFRDAKLNIDGALREKGGQILASLGLSSPLVLHPGSGSPQKNIPLPFFRNAAERAVAESQKQVLVLWGEAEEENLPSIREAFAGLKEVRILKRPLPLGDLAGVLSRSAAYLGNDSGVTQLAAACGLKTFAVFNSTDARVWGPQANSFILHWVQGNL